MDESEQEFYRKVVESIRKKEATDPKQLRELDYVSVFDPDGRKKRNAVVLSIDLEKQLVEVGWTDDLNSFDQLAGLKTVQIGERTFIQGGYTENVSSKNIRRASVGDYKTLEEWEINRGVSPGESKPPPLKNK